MYIDPQTGTAVGTEDELSALQKHYIAKLAVIEALSGLPYEYTDFKTYAALIHIRKAMQSE